MNTEAIHKAFEDFTLRSFPAQDPKLFQFTMRRREASACFANE